MQNGYAGKILYVNLSNSKITQFSTQLYAEHYLGGRGIASRIYWETVSSEVRAFDPENRLILMTGALVATGAQAANRMTVAGKSPMAYPEGYCYGNIGGFFPAELKKAGYDGIVIEGRAPKPVYLWIHDGEIEFRDASSLWGQGAYRAGEILQEAHGDKACFLTTGVAGERMVRSAIIFASHQSTSTAGFGAVMGSKNLKAVVVKGSGKPPVADPQRLKELNQRIIRTNKHFRLDIPPHIEMSSHSHLLKIIGKRGCYQCALECAGGKYRYGQVMEGQRRCQAMEFYLPWTYSQEDEPLETLFDAPTMANDYSIGTFELSDMINWLYACYRAGVLTELETGLPLSKIGTREFLDKLLHSIAYREGFGDVLAEGPARVKERVSEKARALYSPLAAPIGQYDMISPRAFIVHGLLYPMEPRVSQPMLHETAYLYAAWRKSKTDPVFNIVTNKVFHEVARVFWGSYEAGNVSSYEGKALAAKKIQNRTYIKESLGLCDFGWSIDYSFNTPDHLADPNLPAELLNAVTGIDANEIDRYADRIFNLQRIILLREGRKVPQSDYPLAHNFTEPLGINPFYGRAVLVPGRGDEVIDTKGYLLDMERFTAMLKEYYRLRGWHEDTGLPRAETLTALGLIELTSRL